MLGFKIISKEAFEIQTKIRNTQAQIIGLTDNIIAEYKGLVDKYEDYISELKFENIKLKQRIKELENGSYGDRERAAAVNNCEANKICNCEENSEASQNESDI